MTPDGFAFAQLAAVSLAVGVFVGSTGIGGVLLIPVLIFVAGLGVHEAAATTLLSQLFVGAFGAFLFARRGSLELRLLWPVSAGALFCGYAGAQLAARIDASPLALVIGLLIVAASALVLRPPPVLVQARSRAAQAWVLLAVGIAAGFGSGLSGAGGPIFSVPIMLALGFAPLATVGAGQALQIVAATSGSIAHVRGGLVDPAAFALITLFQLVGVSAGVRLAHALPAATLRRLTAWLCIAAGALMVARGA